MTIRAATPCTKPGCRNLSIRGGRCDKCRDVPTSSDNTHRKRTPLHHSNLWRKESIAYRNANPLCEMCLPKRTTPVAAVDHIHEIDDGGDPLNWGNLMSLCHSCHADKTAQMVKARKFRDPYRILRLVAKLKRMAEGGLDE